MNWEEVCKYFEKEFGCEDDLNAILFVIGTQELGKGYQKFSKDEKLDVLHVAICTILEPYGYYEFKGEDKDGWPHFERKQKLPFLKPAEQEALMKEAVCLYMKSQNLN